MLYDVFAVCWFLLIEANEIEILLSPNGLKLGPSWFFLSTHISFVNRRQPLSGQFTNFMQMD